MYTERDITMEKIMIVEDEKEIREDLRLVLTNAGYKTVLTEDFSADAVLAELEIHRPDLVLLDVNLGTGDGYGIARAVRKQEGDAIGNVPIIFLTGRSSSMDELEALTIGGDDFITKPYHGVILLARIAAILKRTGRAQGRGDAQLPHVRGLSLDAASYKVRYQGKETELSKTECKLLTYLIHHEGEVTPRTDLIDYLWDNDVFIDDNALSVNMTRLRTRLKSVGAADAIVTKRGVGYRLWE